MSRNHHLAEDYEYDDESHSKSLSVVQAIDWHAYTRPKDLANIDECKQVDRYNAEAYDFNNRHLNAVNAFLLRLSMPTTTVKPPIMYTSAAIKRREKEFFDPGKRMMAAIKYLAEHGKYPVKDYTLDQAPSEADRLAFSIEVNERIKGGGTDISNVVENDHAKRCTCKNHWDGFSEKCDGKRARLRWKTGTPELRHHFLRPVVVPELY